MHVKEKKSLLWLTVFLGTLAAMGRRDQEAITDLIRVFFTEDGE